MRYLGLSTPLAVAHRGGGAENLENSESAFRHAVGLGYRVIETDVHATADGVLAISHDPQLSRTAASGAEIAQTDWATLSTIRLRNGDRILRLEELAEIVGDAVCLNIDPKSDAAVRPLIEFLQTRPDLASRVCIGSFETKRLKAVRTAMPEVATSLGGTEIRALVVASRSRIKWPRRIPAVAAQVPEMARGVRIITQQFVDYAHDIGLDVHVWTVNAEQDMHRLFDLGVDGLITDRPTTLREVLEARGQWRN